MQMDMQNVQGSAQKPIDFCREIVGSMKSCRSYEITAFAGFCIEVYRFEESDTYSTVT